VQLSIILDDVPSLAEFVDTRDNRNGTWQWIVVVAKSSPDAWAIHTWAEGHLTPIYRRVLANLAANGYVCRTHRKEKDGLMRVLGALAPGVVKEFRG